MHAYSTLHPPAEIRSLLQRNKHFPHLGGLPSNQITLHFIVVIRTEWRTNVQKLPGYRQSSTFVRCCCCAHRSASLFRENFIKDAKFLEATCGKEIAGYNACLKFHFVCCWLTHFLSKLSDDFQTSSSIRFAWHPTSAVNALYNHLEIDFYWPLERKRGRAQNRLLVFALIYL